MKVSVLCTAYNHEEHIRSALEGFVSQKTNFDYEVLIHDDASTDGTADIIREYEKKYPHIIKPIYQTVNQYSQDKDIYTEFLVPAATGEYFAECEGDDYWTDENKLQLQVDFLDQNPQYIACVHNSRMLEMGTGKETVMYGSEDYDIQTTDVLTSGSCCFHTASLMYRRTAYLNLPPFLDMIFDHSFAIHLSLLGPIRYLGKIMSVYRVGTKGSWTATNKQDMHRNALFHKYVASMLNNVNAYTNYAYNQQIEGLVLENEYMELYFDEKYSEMRKPKYAELYRKESLSSRVKMRLKQYLSPVYHWYRKMKYGAGKT